VVLAPDHTTAAAVFDGDVLLMNLGDGTTTTLAVGDAYDVALTTDRLLVSRAAGPLEIRDRGTHAVVASVPGGGAAGGLVASPDGNLVARLRRDGTVEVVDVPRAGVLGILGTPTQILYGFRPGLAFTPDSAALLVAAPDPDQTWGSGALDVYGLAPERLVQVACATAGRDLTPDEWRQFVNDSVPDDLRCARPG
jgi:DNA-binding beta-propeller fold protein YncE